MLTIKITPTDTFLADPNDELEGALPPNINVMDDTDWEAGLFMNLKTGNWIIEFEGNPYLRHTLRGSLPMSVWHVQKNDDTVFLKKLD